MKIKLKHVGLAIAVTFILGFAQNATAGDLIVVATKDTQKSFMDWPGFLETKEVPVRLVTPDSFSEVKGELFIAVLGSPNESKEIAEIAKDALTDDEYKTINAEGKMFYKPQVWNVGQKVILFLGPNQDEVKKPENRQRKSGTKCSGLV